MELWFLVMSNVMTKTHKMEMDVILVVKKNLDLIVPPLQAYVPRYVMMELL